MGCGCNKKVQAQEYVYTSQVTGATSVYSTELQAKAAKVRDGGRGNYFSRPKG